MGQTTLALLHSLALRGESCLEKITLNADTHVDIAHNSMQLANILESLFVQSL